MTKNGNHEDEELAFYALRQLSSLDMDSVERELAESGPLRDRLARVQASLVAYGQSTEMRTVPEGSLDRLMSRIAEESKAPAGNDRVLAFSPERHVGPREHAAKRPGRPMAWLGWGIAAVLAVTVGVLSQHMRRLEATQQDGVASSGDTGLKTATPDSGVGASALDERDALKVVSERQARQVEQLTAEAARARKESEMLRAVVAGQTAELGHQTTAAANAQVEQDRLRGTLAAQAGQVAQLSTAAGVSHQVVDALTDVSAVRVTLIKPKTRPAPTGWATYVQNKGTLVFLASNLARTKDEKVYELWLMPLDGSAPVPAGTFEPDDRGNASVVYSDFPRAVAAKGFAVTVENGGGSQTPTMPILLVGSSGL